MWRSDTYTLTYDAENRLTSVSGAASATFVYDGDGNRIKATFGSATTVYVGNYFEWTGSTTTMKKYYYAGGARVAMREGSNVLYYILTDHLGSTAITVSNGGSEYGELRYYPYGGTRYTSGTTPTSRRFTGQISDATIGLYFYNARYYDATLGRFVQADTIVPSPGNPQAFNRYSYVLNSPLVYRDPSGHAADMGGIGGGRRNSPPPPPPQEDPPPPQVTSREILWGHAVLDLVEFPVGTSGVQETEEWQHTVGRVAHWTGLIIEIGEAVGIAWDFPMPGEEDVLAGIDIGAETAGSIFHGETYLRGRPHPSLPEMTVIGQDVLVSGGDFGTALVAKIVGGTVANLPGLAFGEVVDMFTTGSSIIYDAGRIAGEISTSCAIGFYSEEEGRVHVVLLNYSTSEEAGTSSHH